MRTSSWNCVRWVMSSKKGFLSLFFRCLFFALLAGIATGCLSSLAEILLLLTKVKSQAWVFLIPAAQFYSLIWSFFAFLIAFILFVFFVIQGRARIPAGDEPIAACLFAILIPLALLMVVGGHINLNYLPSYTEPRSLVFNIIFLILSGGLGFWLKKYAIPGLYSWGRSHRLTGGIFLLAACLGVTSFSLWNQKKQNLETVVAREQTPSAPNVKGPRFAQPPAQGMEPRAGTASVPPSKPGAPSAVILISIDALRPDHMSLFGYSRKTTPFLEEFAKEGVVFSNAFANSSWTRASVATMFTSLYPSTHGVNGIASGLAPSLLTLPEVMKAHGYATGIFSANAFVSPLFGYGSGVDRMYSRQVSLFNELILGHVLRSIRKYSPVLHQAYDFLENLELPFGGETRKTTQAEALNRTFLDWVKTLNGKPFFVYFHYMETHTPYATPAPFDQRFDSSDGNARQAEFPLFEPFYPFSKAKPLSESQFSSLVGQYDGAIAYVDAQLEQMFRALKEAGLYDKTLIIVTADHGEEFFDHEGWGHGKSLFNEVVRVPLIIRYPPLFPQGKDIKATARHIDLLPTILKAAGIPVPGPTEGHSLLSFVENAQPSEKRIPVYSEVIHENSKARSIILGDFKLIDLQVYDKQTWLFYNIKNDPQEHTPLDSQHDEVVSELKQQLEAIAQNAAVKAVAPERAKLDEGVREQLRSLGYVQ